MNINAEFIFSLPVNWILGKKGSQLDDPTFKRVRFLCFAYVVGFIYAGVLLASDISSNGPLAIGLDVLIMSCIILMSAVIRWTGAYLLAFHVSVTIVAIVLPTGYFAATGNRTVFLTPVVLVIAYFLLGRIGGVFWTGALLLANLISYEIGKAGTAYLPVSDQSLAYSSLALCVVSVLLFIYEGVNMTNERRIAARDRRLQEVNTQLFDELSKRYDLTVQLRTTLDETKESNIELEETKRILTQSLEDTNKLKEQLDVEKKSVEHQVEVRTNQLREEEARLQASIATLELGFLMTLQDSTVATYNPALLRICGFSKDIQPSTLLSMLTEKIKSSYDLEAAIMQCMSDGKSFDKSDITIGDKFIRILGSAIKLEGSGRALGVVLLVEDMTAAKLLERSENEFVAIASHELRTPITIIQGNLALMEEMHADKLADEGIQHRVAAIKDSSSRMALIVNQFLSMTRLEQRRTVFDTTEIDVSEACNQALTALKPLADQKKLLLKLDIQTDIPKVKADASRLQEVLVNLLSNAIKHTDTGYVEVSASQFDRKITIRVKDTGRGIAVKNQKLLFHKFQQATDNIYTRDESRSTGLGLYISKLLVEQMGGTITLEYSAPQEGAVFSFTLPQA